MSDEAGFIPLSQLRDLFFHARMVWIGGDFGEKDLWRLYVAIETNSAIANHWYSQLDKARNYSPVSAQACPLCVYDDGVFVASCSYHKQIDSLRLEVAELKQVVGDIFIKTSAYYLQHSLETLQRAKETEKTEEDNGVQSEG